MFEWFKKNEKQTVQPASGLSAGLGRKPKLNRLSVLLKSGREISWWVTPWDRTDKITPWVPFYRWYFGRKSDSFVMRFANGETMIRRDDIQRFTVEIVDTT